jgi:GNAT superfamily N-acetyltransferase
MDQPPQPEDVAANTEREERRADVQRRIDEVAGVLAETLLGMWRAKHRAERRGEAWPPPEPPKPEPPRSSVLSDRPKAPRRAFRELAPGDEPVANVLLQTTWLPVLELWLEPAGGKRTRAILEYGRIVMGIVVLDEYGDAAVLRALAVRATHRRQGHGRSLVEFIVRHAYQTGVGRIYAASGTPRFAEKVGFEVRERELLPEDTRRLPGIIDAPRNALVFEMTPTMNGRRAPRRSEPRSASEAIATEPRGPRRRRSSQT